ncbi:MAG: hypothetical protein ABW212_08155, partial [Pseudonocardia sediminis]
ATAPGTAAPGTAPGATAPGPTTGRGAAPAAPRLVAPSVERDDDADDLDDDRGDDAPEGPDDD